MRQTMREVLPQRLPVKVFAMRVDVVVCDVVEAVGRGSRPNVMPGFTAAMAARCAPEYDFVNLALAGREFPAQQEWCA